ncbi:molybdopterin molybdotransferase [Paenibacillus tianmuensis]|uniref:Molybdopterin molybdenumtransferase n=1 Tax=Paenibacillus tianmuensis TaxID=624147 RepID=A0A1G4R825_9BACL|nr:gephyrin-like molybdotransferase Glp [Paenibacillus tianmuensis]SCW52964.1 molybdopterin molybdotransferase [Paenibacillus tianmuensis]
MERLQLSNRFRRNAIQPDVAQKRIQHHIRLGDVERVPLEEAFGRRLAADVFASDHMPHFCRSGMDGFAIRWESTISASSDLPVVLEVIESIPCGSTPTKAITGNTASRIMTGAMVPDGANAVVMLEIAECFEQDGKTFISIKKEQKEGQNITLTGFELAKGELVLEKGRKIHAGEIAVLAAFGVGTVNVFKRPKVAIFATGSELLGVHSPLEPGKIRNSNTHMLAAQVREAGGTPILMESIPDDVDQAMEQITAALSMADCVITTGGVSVGDYDIMVDIFDAWEGTTLFNKVMMRPGSPTTVGVVKDKFLFALSGNPGACFVGFELFVRPVLWGMQGKKDVLPPEATAFLGEDFTKVNAYHRFVRAKGYIEDGKLYVKMAGPDQSSVMLSIKDSDCLMIIPPGGRGVLAGEKVRIIKLGVTE